MNELTYEQIIQSNYISNSKCIFNIDKIIILAEHGHPVGQAYLGMCHYNGMGGIKLNFSKAFDLFKKSAEQGHPLGQAFLGECYDSGLGVEHNKIKAFELFKKSAEQGHPLGQAYLGVCYYSGIGGVEVDYSKAFNLYKKSVDQGHPLGQAYLGSYYQLGRGIRQDVSKAFVLYKKSAEQGHPLGQYFIALCYEQGRGVKQDMEKAIELYCESAIYNYNLSKKAISSLIKYLTYEQLTSLLTVSDNKFVEEIKIALEKYKKSFAYIKLAKWLLNINAECCICYDMINIDNCYITNCLHVFHKTCINNVDKCPLCRKEINEINC